MAGRAYRDGFPSSARPAQLNQRVPASLLRSHPGAQVVLDVHLEMALEFFRHLLLATPAAKQAGQTDQPGSKWSHDVSGRYS